jgi:hypothetical protein
MKLVVRVLALALVLSPALAIAAGGHDAVGCSGCHALHGAKGEWIFAVAPNTKYLNPKTKQPYGGTTALCLACHQEADKGGQGMAPISQHNSHPFDSEKFDAKVAVVPAEYLRKGRFECLSCHDPHPANTNHAYLRIDTKGGKNMDAFCGACHASKGEAAKKPAIAPATQKAVEASGKK